MLDKFLQVAYKHEKTAESKQTTIDLLKQLPNELLQKIATGEEKLSHYITGGSDCGSTWLDRFRGTPLFDQALQLDQQSLEQEMQRAQQSQANRQMYDEQDQAREQLCIQKKQLDLQLAQQEEQEVAGGGEAIPPSAEAAPPVAPATP